MNTHDFLPGLRNQIYFQIIERGRQRGNRRPGPGYEQHHIVPECFFINRTREGPPGWLEGDPDDPLNLVFLTCREHFIVHRLLIRITTGIARSKMTIAIKRMMDQVLPGGECHRLTARSYQVLQKQIAEARSLITAEYWDNLSPEEYAARCDARKKYWSSLSSEEHAVRTAYFKHVWSNLSSQEYVARCAAMKAGANSPDALAARSLASKNVWATLSSEEYAARCEIRKKNANRPERLAKNREERDKTVYQWTHNEGNTFVGTREQHREAFKWPKKNWLNALFGPKSRKMYRGWSVQAL